MTGKKTYRLILAVLCALAAGCLCGGALYLYFDGAAGQAAGDPFYPMYTRERVWRALIPALPLLFAILAMTLAGRMLGIREEIHDAPVRAAGKPSAAGGQRQTLLRAAVLILAILLIIAGIINGGLEDVLDKGSAVCSECVGLG